MQFVFENLHFGGELVLSPIPSKCSEETAKCIAGPWDQVQSVAKQRCTAIGHISQVLQHCTSFNDDADILRCMGSLVSHDVENICIMNEYFKVSFKNKTGNCVLLVKKSEKRLKVHKESTRPIKSLTAL